MNKSVDYRVLVARFGVETTYLFTILSTVDIESGSRIRAVVGYRMVEVPQTLGCDVISHAGLGRIVVDVACDAENVIATNGLSQFRNKVPI